MIKVVSANSYKSQYFKEVHPVCNLLIVVNGLVMTVLSNHWHLGLCEKIFDFLVHFFHSFIQSWYLNLVDTCCSCHIFILSISLRLLLCGYVVAWMKGNCDWFLKFGITQITKDERILTGHGGIKSKYSLIFASTRVDDLVIRIKNKEVNQLLGLSAFPRVDEVRPPNILHISISWCILVQRDLLSGIQLNC